MDRDTLLKLLSNMNDESLAVKLDGTLVDEDNDEHAVEDLEAAVEELTADLTALIEWAKSAPKYEPAKVAA